jgi:hypothetical protein
LGYFLFFAAALSFERDAALAGLLAFFGAAFPDLLEDLLEDLLAGLAAGFAGFFAGAAFFAGTACDACAA